MTPARATRVTVGCIAATTVLTAGAKLVQGERPPTKMVIGGAFAALTLTAIGMAQPELAAQAATLVLVGSVFYTAGPLFNAIITLTTQGA